ncbi:hypothetical protein ACHAW5_008666 [Stephanodiscus triporus]|uniref:Growth arrest-specific protein 8 domain-containing protein n=1 Tax=Stephanodiscus triporus TaxID=2934178 RepID=A0ABD3PCY9_9STRA
MPKKSKSKSEGEGKEPEIPAEWVGKTVDELRSLVAQYKCDLEAASDSRNKAQVEHASIQSYIDVTREEVRELDMLIEKRDLEIENAEEDNASELLIYKQKANFIKYCHDNTMKEALDQSEMKMKNASAGHVQQVQTIEGLKMSMRNDMIGLEAQKANKMSVLQQESNAELALVKAKLDAGVKEFEHRCDEQQMELIGELDSRRAAELKLIIARRESHLSNLIESHKRRCKEMRVYYDGVERQQEIDIEDLEAEIRRLKKAAIENESNSYQLKESNERCGEELRTCSEMVAALACKTRDKEKNATSMRSTNMRLSATRKAIAEVRLKYKNLQEKFNKTEEERNIFREGIHDATLNASKLDATKAKLLHDELSNREGLNSMLHQHLQHTLSSAGLDKAKSDALLSNMQGLVDEVRRDMEKLNISIFHATESYYKQLQTCRSELEARGVSNAQVDSINVLNKEAP